MFAAPLEGSLARFLAQSVLILAMSRIVSLGTQRLGQPTVVAEIIAGILLGPSLLGLLWPDAMALVFPASSMPLLGIASHIGLVLFMFLVGLEMDPLLLRGRGQASFLISQATVIVPFLLGAAFAFVAADHLHDVDAPASTFALFMGVGLSITAFPVLARILTERRILRSRIGTLAIACAAANDVLGWCVLAFVASLARTGTSSGAVWTLLFTAAYLLVMLFLVRPLLVRLTAHVAAKETLNHPMVAGVFMLLLGSAFVTEVIGVHALFGAFLMGAVMPRQGGLSQALAERLEDPVVAFLLPLFFAYSGLRTEIGLLDTPGEWWTCLALVLVACVGKLGGTALVARWLGTPWREAWSLGILLNTRGLMALVVINVGLDVGVLSPRVFTMMVVMSLVTTIVTVPLLDAVLPASLMTREILAEKAAAEGEAEALPAVDTFTMLVCVAHGPNGPGLVHLAASISRRGAARIFALWLMRPEERMSQVREEGPVNRATLEPLLERAKELAVEVRPLSFVSSRPSDDICNVAEVKRADLVLLGYHRPILGGKFLGGIVAEVMERCRCPVAMLFERNLGAIRRVLVPYSGSEHDIAALSVARRLSQAGGIEIVLMHIIDPDREGPRRRGLEQAADEVFPDESRNRVIFKLVVHRNPATAVLTEVVRDYDMLIIGADASWGLDEGRFALRNERILRESTVSVLVVHRGVVPPTEAAR